MKKDVLKNLLKVLTSNIFNLASSIVITFLLPNIFGPTDYGYWSLYLLYTSYAGFIIFGYCDGIYLKLIGQKYESLNFSRLKFFLLILFLYLFIGGIIILPITFFLNIEVTKWYVILFSILGIILSCLNSFFILINQATQKYNYYAIGNVIEKVTIMICVIIAILFKAKNIIFIIVSSLCGKMFTLTYYLIKNNRILKSNYQKTSFYEIFDNIKIGFFLTISSIFSMLMTGLGKFFVENNYGIDYLGYYSFVFSLFSPFTQLTDAIALVLIPRLKQNISNAKKTILRLNSAISYLTPIPLLFYLFGKYCILFIFPKYINSINCFMYLCPIIVIQARVSVIYNSYYKIMRKEKLLLFINSISLLFNVIMLFTGKFIFKNFESVALITFLAFLVRDIINKIYMNKKFDIKMKILDYYMICIAIYFIIIFMKINDLYLMAILLLLLIVSILFKRKAILGILGGGK